MIVGRKEEIAELNKLYYSDRPEFVAVYGDVWARRFLSSRH